MIGRLIKIMFKLFVLLVLLSFLIAGIGEKPVLFFGGFMFLLFCLVAGYTIAFVYLDRLTTAENDVLRPWFAWYWPPSVLNAIYDKLTVRNSILIHTDGLIFKKEETIPVSKIQNFSAERANVGDIIFGRLTYQIFTAGHAGVEVVLHGYPKVLKPWLEKQVG